MADLRSEIIRFFSFLAKTATTTTATTQRILAHNKYA